MGENSGFWIAYHRPIVDFSNSVSGYIIGEFLMFFNALRTASIEVKKNSVTCYWPYSHFIHSRKRTRTKFPFPEIQNLSDHKWDMNNMHLITSWSFKPALFCRNKWQDTDEKSHIPLKSLWYAKFKKDFKINTTFYLHIILHKYI